LLFVRLAEDIPSQLNATVCYPVSSHLREQKYTGPGNARVNEAIQSVRPETRLVLLNLAGLVTLIAFTGLVYLRTQEPLILLVGGLIAVVSVLGAMMRKG
jgi:hypothetical protein